MIKRLSTKTLNVLMWVLLASFTTCVGLAMFWHGNSTAWVLTWMSSALVVFLVNMRVADVIDKRRLDPNE